MLFVRIIPFIIISSLLRLKYYFLIIPRPQSTQKKRKKKSEPLKHETTAIIDHLLEKTNKTIKTWGNHVVKFPCWLLNFPVELTSWQISDLPKQAEYAFVGGNFGEIDAQTTRHGSPLSA